MSVNVAAQGIQSVLKADNNVNLVDVLLGTPKRITSAGIMFIEHVDTTIGEFALHGAKQYNTILRLSAAVESVKGEAYKSAWDLATDVVDSLHAHQRNLPAWRYLLCRRVRSGYYLTTSGKSVSGIEITVEGRSETDA